MDKTTTGPITLCKVLEEEYVCLHRALPPDYHNRYSSEKERLQEIVRLIHNLPAGARRAAICLSGGGIRSGSFALGVLQGLARYGLLARFLYLSTVSGPGNFRLLLSASLPRERG